MVLIGFEKGKWPKKYNAIIMSHKTGRIKRIPFGDRRYQQYRDRTPLKLYSHLDHNDPERRRRYYLRHGKATKWSPKYFSHRYLW